MEITKFLRFAKLALAGMLVLVFGLFSNAEISQIQITAMIQLPVQKDTSFNAAYIITSEEKKYVLYKS